MKYFLIHAEEEANPIPVITNWHNKININYIKKGMAYNIPKWTILEIKNNSETIFTDILSYPFFIVSEMVKEVIEFYDSTMEWKRLILFDKLNQVNQLYYLPILEEINLFEKENKEHLMLSMEQEKNLPVFKVNKRKNSGIVVRLDLIESILRRNPIGISLTEADF